MKQKLTAAQKYNKNPNVCLCCFSPILISVGTSAYATRQKKFCNHTCSAKYNNPVCQRKQSNTMVCKLCCVKFPVDRNSSGIWRRHTRCPNCRNTNSCGTKRRKYGELENLTRQQVRDIYGNRHYNDKLVLGNHALKKYKDAKLPFSCAVCGYDKHTPICHIKQVKEFTMDAFVYDINEIHNLITLCCTHHWELDHGMLPKDDARILARLSTY